ncbi:XynC protein [Pasteurella multocida]|nr:XynC protein [Pasteurella multocida]
MTAVSMISLLSQTEHYTKKLLDLNIPHHYTEKPGGHSWVYWKDSIALHTHFFSQKFAQAKEK